MKRYCFLLVLIILFSMSIQTFAESLKPWGYYKDINISGSNKYKEVFLDQDIYKYAKSDLSDLRIVDQNNSFIPYYIDSKYQEYNENISTYNSSLVLKFNKRHDAYFDFRMIPSSENTDILIDKLSFNVNSNEFYKNINVFGSYDGVKWEYQFNDSIYSVQNMKKNHLLMPTGLKYNFYRIEIIDNVENIIISNLLGHYTNKEIIDKSYTKTLNVEFDIQNTEKETIITVKNPNKLRISQLSLKIDEIFKREYSVYYKAPIEELKGTNAIGNTDRFVSSGEIYNLKFKGYNVSNTVIDFENSLEYESIIIKIKNNDDKPLNISTIEGSYYLDKLVFEPAADGKFKIYFGNIKAQRPTYDIESYKKYVNLESKDECTLGALNVIKPQKVSNIPYQLILNITMGIVSVGLIGLIIMKLRKSKG